MLHMSGARRDAHAARLGINRVGAADVGSDPARTSSSSEFDTRRLLREQLSLPLSTNNGAKRTYFVLPLPLRGGVDSSPSSAVLVVSVVTLTELLCEGP